MENYFGVCHHDNATKSNLSLMNQLQEEHNIRISAGAGDPDFDAMIAEMLDPHTKWVKAFTTWASANGISQGSTKQIQDDLKTLSGKKSKKWNHDILGIYDEDSADYKALLPHKRREFRRGSQLERINYIQTVAERMVGVTALAAIQADMLAYYAVIKPHFDDHTQKLEALRIASKSMEPLRIALAQAMFANEGRLMTKFKTEPKKVDLYFDVKAMRKYVKKVIPDEGLDIPLQPGELLLLNVRFEGTEKWLVENLGDHDACIFFSDKDDVTIAPADAINIPAGESKEIDLNTIDPKKRFAYAVNLSQEDEGELSITELI